MLIFRIASLFFFSFKRPYIFFRLGADKIYSITSIFQNIFNIKKDIKDNKNIVKPAPNSA